MVKIIYVSGLLPRKKAAKGVEKLITKYLKEEFENVVFLNPIVYFYNSTQKVLKMKQDLHTEITKSSDEVILIGHSYGGVIIGSLELKKYKNITQIIVIASPINSFSKLYDLIVPGFKKTRKELQFRKENFVKEKTHSIGFYFDFIVPVFMTKVKGVYHKNYFAEHFLYFYFSRTFFRKIFKDLKLF